MYHCLDCGETFDEEQIIHCSFDAYEDEPDALCPNCGNNQIEETMRLEHTIDKNIEALRIRVLGPSTPARISMAHWDAGRVSGLLGGAFLTGELPFEARDFLESVTNAWLTNFIRSVSVTDLNTGETY